MKRSEGIMAVIGGLALALAGEARAGNPAATSSAPYAGQGQVAAGQVVRGEVQKVDRQRHALELSGGQGISLEQGTIVTKDGRAASLNDIEQGDDVRASFTPDGALNQVSASTSPQRIRDGIPQTQHQKFLHQVWSDG